MEQIKLLSIASLLHDVGKFIERSGIEKSTHSNLGKEFLSQIEGLDKNIAKLVGAHHNPEELEDEELKKLAHIIQIGDWLSSTERIETSINISEKRQFQGTISIFEEVFSDPKKIKPYEETKKYFPDKLSFNRETIFPRESLQNLENNYKKNYESFLSEFAYVIKETVETKISIATLLSTLEKYFWAVPSATYWEGNKNYPDISLFDHSKITSAISVSLYLGVLKNCDNESLKLFKENIKNKKNLEETILTLIHGDFSGIQNFITNITSKLAAKSLKGRSLGLVFMQRFIAEHILKNLNLDLQNLIYAGGGHFYILAYPGVEEKIAEIKKDINKEFLEHFGLDLYLAIGITPITLGDFLENKIGEVFRKSSEDISKEKSKKFKDIDYSLLFEPKGTGGRVEVCEICGKEGNLTSYEGHKLCEDCDSFVKLAEYIKEAQQKGFFNVKDVKEMLPILKNIETLVEEYAITFQNNSEKLLPVFQIPTGFPLDREGRILSFDELGIKAEERTGTNKLGIFKADVDNLGQIITGGLSSFGTTFARISALSRQMSMFFEGYINNLTQNDERFKDNIYLIYSGGDDTFAIGSWDRIIEYAQRVYEDFREFTAKNPNITMSASVVITSPHSSVRRILRESENKLEQAKDFTFNRFNHTKNAINIFGETLMWDVKDFENEFGHAIKLSQEINENILKRSSNDKIEGRSQLQKIKEIILKAYENFLEEKPNTPEIVSSLWRLRYFWMRNFIDEEEWQFINDPETKNGSVRFYQKINSILEKEIFNMDNYNKLSSPRLGEILIALRISELQTREKKNKEE